MSHRSITYIQHNENNRYLNIDNSAKAWKEDLIADPELNVLQAIAGSGSTDDPYVERTPTKTKATEERKAPALVYSPSLDDLNRPDAVTFVLEDVHKLSMNDVPEEDARRASSVVSSDTTSSTSSSSSANSVEVPRRMKSPKKITFRRSTGDIRQSAYSRMTEDFFNNVDFRLHSFKSTKAGMTQVWYNSLLCRTNKIDMRSKYGVFMLTRM